MPSRAVENPYAYVVGASAVNICLVRFGYLTSDQAVELLFDAASDEGITAYQVGNLIKASGFKSDNPKVPTLFQVADVDTGVINWVNADLVTHICPRV